MSVEHAQNKLQIE